MGQQEKLWNSNYWKVMTANFALFFAFYLLTPLLPLYLSEHFHSTKDVIGIVLSGYTLTALLMRPFSGFLVDRFNRYKVLITCYFFFFILFAGYLAASSLLLFAIVRTLHGAPFGAVTVANSTMAIEVLPSSRRNEGIGYYGLSNNFAMAFAPTVGLFIYNGTHNFDLLFWLALIVAGIGLFIDTTLKVIPLETTTSKIRMSAKRFLLWRGWSIAVNMCFFGFCFGVLSNYLAIYGKEQLGINSGTGTYFMILSAGLIISRLHGSRLLRKGRLVYNAGEGVIISTFAYLLFISCHNMAAYYLSALLLGLGNGHFWPAFQNMIINLAHYNERGTANSTILVSWDIGIGLGALIGGFLSEMISYQFAFWTVSAVQALGMLFFFFVTQKSYNKHYLIKQNQ